VGDIYALNARTELMLPAGPQLPECTGVAVMPEHTAAGLAELDVLLEVRDGDVLEVPYGYHGPCVAAPGYPMYYLNVLAGNGSERSMAFCDDPAHTWIRDTWGSPT